MKLWKKIYVEIHIIMWFFIDDYQLFSWYFYIFKGLDLTKKQ
jgi:hypothetical protein